MYMLYGLPFMQHTYLHHLTRVDHRHNFFPYNILLYLSAAREYLYLSHFASLLLHFESLAFIPQLFLSAVAIPLVLARKSLPGTMLAQTFAFVTFNKVCTSQVRYSLSLFLFSLPLPILRHRQ
jgi:GPI mannosyltransferase 1 subunit M